MSKINMDNVNRILTKYDSLYRDMLDKYYMPLLDNFIQELLSELGVTEYSTDIPNKNYIYKHIFILDNKFQISQPEKPYGNSKYTVNQDCWNLFGYIESGQYDKEKNRAERNKSRKR